MANVAERVRAEIEARQRELRPLVQEAEQLDALLAAWERVVPSTSTPSPQARVSRPARPPRRSRQSVAQREAAILAVLGRRPGIDPAALAREVGLSRVRLSQLLKPLEQAGRVTRAHGGLFADTGQTDPGRPRTTTSRQPPRASSRPRYCTATNRPSLWARPHKADAARDAGRRSTWCSRSLCRCGRRRGGRGGRR